MKKQTQITVPEEVREFVSNVTKDLVSERWGVRDDGDSGMPDNVMDTVLGRSIQAHVDRLLGRDAIALRIRELRHELAFWEQTQRSRGDAGSAQ